MQKTIMLMPSLTLLLCSLVGCATPAGGNYTDAMKIPHVIDLSAKDGADAVERDGDHKDSPYFSRVDFYNAKPSASLTILEHFKTQQQTSEWSCGVAAALMVLNWYGKLGQHNEASLAEFRTPNGAQPSTTNLRNMIEVFNGVGDFALFSTFDVVDTVADVFTLDFIQKTLKAGTPIMIGWNDWGGHWQVIIGYDTMGTATVQDDVLIVADPYDTTDHNQDGYGVYSAERFLYNFTFYDYFPDAELNDMVFLVAVPQFSVTHL
ncbi:MAG: C39 family peptidase [Pseudomonadales bacterium]|jgi:hypothetical protein|nr:C39 family peptidase [Pseudomonadales bacterium]